MTIYNGAIELNPSPGVRAPEFLYHNKQFRSTQPGYQLGATPNYGVNRNFPTTERNVYDGLGFGPEGGPYVGSVTTPPRVAAREIMGDCRRVQFITAVYGTPPMSYYFSYYDYASSVLVDMGGYIIFDTPGFVYSYVQVIPENITDNYVAELNVAWTIPYPGPNSQYTLIYGIDPNVQLTSVPRISTNGQIPWRSYLNGVAPNEYAIYGSIGGIFNVPSSCSTWMPNSQVGMYFGGEEYDLGFAMYKDTFLTADEINYWNNEHNWLEDPGFV